MAVQAADACKWKPSNFNISVDRLLLQATETHKRMHQEPSNLPDTAVSTSMDTAYMLGLPIEVLCMVLKQLLVLDLVRASHVCKRWRRVLMDNPTLWSKLDCSFLASSRSKLRISNQMLEWLARRSRQTLQLLIVPECSRLTATSLAPFRSYRLAGLSTIVLTNNSKISGSTLVDLARSAPNLASLTLDTMRQLDSLSLRILLIRCIHLKELYITNCTAVTSSAFTHLEKMQCSLVKLGLAGCSISDSVIEYLAGFWCQSLIAIDLSRCRLLTRHTLLHLALFKRLESVKIDSLNLSLPKNLSIQDSFLIFAEGCSSLSTLSMRDCPELTSQCILYILQLCDSLSTLHIPGSAQINDQVLLFMIMDGVCDRIVDLNISQCPRLTSSALLPFASKLGHIKRFIASSCPGITDNIVQAVLSASKALEYLDISLCPNVRGSGLHEGIQAYLNNHPSSKSSGLMLNVSSNPQIRVETITYLKNVLGEANVASHIG
ncbi:hypothetical protein BATDEDRAFT_23160 [Batrachochytrium dendrobatidis JAM81]|uniref:F-box domain-containing protein n=2 Tax=Batrachochytrium dendrobatidis TaxID=109871 RepID=F4NWX0_BATDJ|nr:uncharacterized protein BATDEDRAFT_23160 [Batrachochytrium dendrobatidis JAM81]EGF82894.1 hypothetical protein BATDEDRAFT_23160 [Batrachochytrium dendrobatidis JAM81]KAJ8327870.1 hypothetical protein O5D80_003267 [Batrachochytrium dendrobatidis]KAK5667181.1 hypothetical protein QVD99_006389 [Batrachochytrium dendrobatidis]|eukprot:XP_006676714.1 hypothetical protein BATDEDRAFT_23160 [Batrachochytrium dendrobatidis JAM81]